MNPKAAEIAMEQMRRMTPEQMAHMQQQMGNVTPDMMQQAMQQMRNMGTQDWDNLAARMNGIDPSTLTDMAGDASSHYRAKQEYIYKGSLQLKAEGNKLISMGRYSEAIKQYSKARSNMASCSDENARQLWKACSLNLALCHLKLSQYPNCVEQCAEVLQGDPQNLKALYRRGEAYRGLGQLSLAAADLKQALQLSKGDPAQESSIQEKLEAVEEALAKSPSAEDGDVEEIPSNLGQESSAYVPKPGVIIEEVVDDEPSPSSIRHDGSAPRGTADAGNPTAEASHMGQAASMLCSNPDLMKQTAQMMANMPDEQLAALSKASGLNMPPDMVRSAHAAMENLTPDMMEQMASVASSMPRSAPGPASTAGPEAGPDPTQMLEPEQIQQWTEMCKKNPEFIKKQFEMLSEMNEEELNEMARLRGFPEGYKMSPEMAKNAAKSMSEMTPEELASVAAQYNLFKESGGASPAQSADAHQGAQWAPRSGTGGPEVMSGSSAGQLDPMGNTFTGPGGAKFTPEMMRSTTDMMSKMTPEQLSEMTRMASQMGGAGVPSMSDSQAPMGMMGGMGGMEAMLDNPEAMKSMAKMMQSMDEAALTEMCMSSGMAKTRAQAEDMAQKMKQMSPGQVEMMVKASAYLQKGVKAVKKTREFLMGRVALVVAILVIVVGVVLRYMGYM